MKALFSALLLAAAAPAPAALLFWREPSDGRIRPAQALFDQKRHHEVVATLTPEFMQGLRGTDLRQAYVLLGESLDLTGRDDEAIGVYQLGVKLFPKNVDLLTRLGGVLHRNGLDEQARPLLKRAISYEPRHFGAHQALAEINRKLGFLERAAEHYEAALETLGGRAEVWRDYAETLLAQREWKTAALALERAASLEPENSDGLVLTAFARRAQGDYDGALAALDRAAALGAGTGVRRAKALWLVEAGRPAEARAEAEALLKAEPDDAAALWALARARLSDGRRAEAAAALAPLTEARRDDFPARAARTLRSRLEAR